MTKEDAFNISELDKLCFAVPWSQKLFEEELENAYATYFVAKENGIIIGYGGVWKISGEGQITNIAVHPDHRKKRIGSQLLECILFECADMYQIILEVRESNLPAIALYEKYGFIKAGIRKNFYHSPIENGITMVRGDN